MSHPLIAFYSGKGTDHAGRTLEDILAQDDDFLESNHDFIQWLFPLPEPSPFNPQAPVLDEEARQAFRSSPELRAQLRRAFARMLAFYGLVHEKMQPPCGAIHSIPPILAGARPHWLRPSDHNHLRITRILRSIRLLGLEDCSAEFLRALEEIIRLYPNAVTPTSQRYWRRTQDQ